MVFKIMNQKYDKQGDVAQLFDYLTQERKTEHQLVYSYYFPFSLGGEGVENLINLMRKKSGQYPTRHVYHFILSFDSGIDNITCAQAYDLGEKIIYFSDLKFYPMFYAIHEDVFNVHIHFMVNAIDFNGNRMIDKRETYMGIVDDIKLVVNGFFNNYVIDKDIKIIYGQ